MAEVSTSSLVKKYGAFTALHGIDLEIEDGEFIVFVGPSGSGKSTLLRCIAGLEPIASGSVRISGEDVSDVDPADRGLSMVFQNYALFPHMTCRANLEFPLKSEGLASQDRERMVNAVGKLLHIEELLDRRPAELSGGQRQRVAIGRAIVKEPKVFLFDEPLSNLDAELRIKMRVEITKLHRQIQNTIIYVTHDQVEAMTMADRIVVLRDGKIEQVGTPHQLYFAPVNQFVATFIGAPQMNLVKCDSAIRNDDNTTIVRFGDAPETTLPIGDLEWADGNLTLGFRPEHVLLNEPDGETIKLRLRTEVVEHLGAITNIYGKISDSGANHTDITVASHTQISFQEGKEIDIWVPVGDCHLFTLDGKSLKRHTVPPSW
jgi:ABC-type sugar transport system ATPase subunit